MLHMNPLSITWTRSNTPFMDWNSCEDASDCLLYRYIVEDAQRTLGEHPEVRRYANTVPGYSYRRLPQPTSLARMAASTKRTTSSGNAGATSQAATWMSTQIIRRPPSPCRRYFTRLRSCRRHGIGRSGWALPQACRSAVAALAGMLRFDAVPSWSRRHRSGWRG